MPSKFTSLAGALSTPILVVCALVITEFVVRDQLRQTTKLRSKATFVQQKDWSEYATGGHWIGDSIAPVQIVEFADFECPACATLHTRLDELRAKHPNSIAILYRHLPLEMHKFSKIAAIASECAAVQNKFAEMLDSLFANQKTLGLKPWSEIAFSAGVLESSQFVRCMKDPASSVRVETDNRAATKLGATGTPTVLINGLRFAGAPPKEVLDSLIIVASQNRPSPNAARN